LQVQLLPGAPPHDECGGAHYPKDEAPAAYKDFNELLNSVRLTGLASEVAHLRARFVIKDSDDSLKGAA
jgi:tRNA-splicing ligase RtcB